MQSFDMSPIVNFMVREGASKADAEDQCRALLQWMAGHAVQRHQTPYVMLNGKVDQAFHAFILNTKAYHAFCDRYVGWFIHHTPLDAEQAAESTVLAGISYTTDFLQAEFGSSLHPLLNGWVHEAEKGNVTVAAVSCIGNGYDDVESLAKSA